MHDLENAFGTPFVVRPCTGAREKLFHLLSVRGEIAFNAVCIYIANGITRRFSIEDNRVPILLSSILKPLMTFTVHM